MCENCMKASDMVPLLKLAKEAIGTGENKWKANQELLTWFRSDPESVILALQAAARVCERPGGLNNARMMEAIRDLKPLGHFQAVK